MRWVLLRARGSLGGRGVWYIVNWAVTWWEKGHAYIVTTLGEEKVNTKQKYNVNFIVEFALNDFFSFSKVGYNFFP